MCKWRRRIGHCVLVLRRARGPVTMGLQRHGNCLIRPISARRQRQKKLQIHAERARQGAFSLFIELSVPEKEEEKKKRKEREKNKNRNKGKSVVVTSQLCRVTRQPRLRRSPDTTRARNSPLSRVHKKRQALKRKMCDNCSTMK